ncbi:MAG: glycerol kinase GlpK [Ruminococcaceae bacterium]|nr:glycerol kinase GlpK [Oscillospiraceae bacterium]
MQIGKYVMALDEGTTSSRAVIFNAYGAIAGMGQKEFTQYYPQPGYVEQDPVEILEAQLYAMREAVAQAGIKAEDIACIGITNQRETTVAWDSLTGVPICNAIVWQCRRTAPECQRLKEKGWGDYIYRTTGLIIDAYFSGTKMKWILDNVPAAKELAAKGRLRFGTIDTWLVYSLTDGQAYVTDVSNASRTMLFDIHRLCWDQKLIEEFGIPRGALPQVVESSGIVGMCQSPVLGLEIPIAGIAGDQHAALFGQCCFEPGMAKNTYGTGCFMLMNTGDRPVQSANGLLTTIGWRVNGKVTYALEGSAFHAGSAINWLRDGLKIIHEPRDADVLAESVPDSSGVVFVPAFTGLGAPYWDMYARGELIGLTRGTTDAHIARAVLESIAYETYDLFECMQKDAGVAIRELRVDGGVSRSRFLMQFQSDLTRCSVYRPACVETTAMGAAMLAGLAVGMWESMDELCELWKAQTEFSPDMESSRAENLLKRWHKAVQRCRGWEDDSE